MYDNALSSRMIHHHLFSLLLLALSSPFNDGEKHLKKENREMNPLYIDSIYIYM
jgi:hypothetical protein